MSRGREPLRFINPDVDNTVTAGQVSVTTINEGGLLGVAPAPDFDNNNPFDSDGYTPIDERPGRLAWDTQRTSENSNDLRGKILRITPQGRWNLHDSR